MALIERPYQKCFSKNDIRYVFQLADLSRTGLFLQVRIKYKALADASYTELYTFDLKPTSTGYVYFYLQNHLDALVSYVLPAIGQLITSADKQAVNFYIEYREVTDDDTDPGWITTESAHACTCFKGGIEKNKYTRYNIFYGYIETAKPFLTWQPTGHFVFYDENVFLSFINPTPGTAIELMISCKSIAPGIQYLTLNLDGAATLYHLNVGPQILFDNNLFSVGNMHYYEVTILTSDGSTVLINAYRFYIEYRPLYKKYYDLVYASSLGGIDSVRVIGETSVGVNRDYDEGEGGINLDWTSKVNTHETTQDNFQLQRDYKGDIGYLRNRTKKQQESFIESLASKNIYQLIDSRWIPITSPQKSVDLGKNTDTKQSFPIEWSLAETNEVYTPEDSTFGAGIDTTICYPVTISGELPNGTVGDVYNGILNITGGSLPITAVTADSLPAGMTVAYNADNNTIVFGGTPTAAFSGTVTLHITNCTTANINVALTINEADDGGGDTGTHFGETVFVSGDDWNDSETTEMIGQPDEELVITVSEYDNGNMGTLTFNGITITANGQTINITLDGSGSSGTIAAVITGNPSGPTPSVIKAKFTITSATGGSIGSTDTYTISKVY